MFRLQRYVKILETTKLLRKNFRYWSKKDERIYIGDLSEVFWSSFLKR